MKRLLIVLLLALPILIAAVTFTGQEQPSPAKDEGFRLTTLTGESIALSDLRGRPVVLNFWASWCTPCKEEMGELMRVQEQYADEGLVILAINMTFDDTLSEVQKFVDTQHLTLTVLLDETGAVTRQQYRVVGVPTSIFIDRNGQIVNTHMGAMSGTEIVAEVTKIITN